VCVCVCVCGRGRERERERAREEEGGSTRARKRGRETVEGRDICRVDGAGFRVLGCGLGVRFYVLGSRVDGSWTYCVRERERGCMVGV
jgi:hypothetical protein